MMKSKKAKVAAGVVVVGMVASMGTAFAATDAGGQLQGWYNSASNTIKSIVSGDFTTYKDGAKAANASTVNGIIGQAREDIRDAGNAEKKRVKDEINGQVGEYASQIDGAQASITSSMPGEYDSFVAGLNASANTEIAGIGAQNKSSINSAIRNHTGVYKGRLQTETAATHDAAVQTLTNKINDAKNALNDLLAQEQTTANQELADNLNTQISNLQAELQAMTDAGVAASQAAIEDLGAELLEDSLADLDQLVIDALN